MLALLRWTGVPQLISFYRYVAINVPRATTLVGVLLLWGIAAVRIYLLLDARADPVYLQVYFALVAAAAVGASIAMLAYRRRSITRLGWALGSLVSTATIVIYLLSRTAGLPGLPGLIGWWDFPLGTFALTLEAVFLIGHFTVLTGLMIAVPDRRDWHD